MASNERGSALLIAILASAVLGAGLMGVLTLSGAERRTVMNQHARTDAYAVAETGLQQFVANRIALGFTSSPAAASESTRVTVSGGYADVVLTRLRPAVGALPALYVVRSHGFATRGSLSGTPVAERQVAQLAQWSTGSMVPLGAFTAINGLTKQGASGSLAGADACGVNASIAGVAVGAPGYTQNGNSVPRGNPNILSLGTAAQAASTVTIDWNGIVNNGAVTPDVSLPGGTWPTSWPVTTWRVIKVTGNYTLPSTGRGLLIVTGNLTVGARTWDGVILVGGQLIVTGNMVLRGAIVSGLNVKLGSTVAASTINNGTRTFQYNSCNVASALGSFAAGLALVPNAWMDNWDGW